MTTAIPKLGAMAGAACLLATMALPAHASPLIDTTAESVAAPPSQTLTVGAVASSVVTRDSPASIAIPVPVAPVVVQVADAEATAGPAAATKSSGSSASAEPVAETAAASSYSGSAVLDYASQFVGVVPYGMGNTPDTSFSCDGFVQYVFAAFGYSLPRGADHQAAQGTVISKSQAVAGDLVWWPGQHIGIYDGAGGMYDSPNWGRFVQHPAQLWGSPTFVRLG